MPPILLTMKSFEYISLLSVMVWVIVPFFFYQSKHFWFFLFLGVNDVIASLFWFGFGLSSQTLWVPVYYLIVLSIDEEFFFNKRKKIIFGFLVVLIFNYYSTTFIQSGFVLIAQIIIFTIFVRYLYWAYIKENKKNFFYAVMTFYSLFSVYKSVLTVGNINTGLNDYFVGIIIQIFIGLILIFMKRDFLFSFKR